MSRKKVAKIPGVWGGRYFMIPRSRIPVFLVADMVREGGERLLRDSYLLDDDQVLACLEFLRDHGSLVQEDKLRYENDERRIKALVQTYGKEVLGSDGSPVAWSLDADSFARMNQDGVNFDLSE